MMMEDHFYLIANTRQTVAKTLYRRQPNWVLVRDMFGCGATMAWDICKAARIDGDSCKVERVA